MDITLETDFETFRESFTPSGRNKSRPTPSSRALAPVPESGGSTSSEEMESDGFGSVVALGPSENARLEWRSRTGSSITDMSSKTKLALLAQIDHMKQELQQLKMEKTLDKERMRYLEEQREMFSVLRVREVKNLVLRSQELDVAFLVDATGSMKSSMKLVYEKISYIAEEIIKEHPRSKNMLRFALAIYRDYDDKIDPKANGTDFTRSYDGPSSEFRRAVASIRCDGGGDGAEDVFTGLETAASLSWQGTSRLLIHIADAPCHGSRFHHWTSGDHFLGGDKLGRNIEDILAKLRSKCRVDMYCFCHLNDSTEKMVKEFKLASGNDDWIQEWKISDINKVAEKVVEVSISTISRTLSGIRRDGPSEREFVREQIDKSIPLWDALKPEKGVEWIHREFSSLKDLLEKLQKGHGLDLIPLRKVDVRIAPHPFTDEGAVRWPFYSLVLEEGSSTDPSVPQETMVLKRFKLPFGKSPLKVHSKERYVDQMEVQTIAGFLAKEFNQRTARWGGVTRVEFLKVSLIEVGGRYYTMDKLLHGHWIRFSNNAQYVNMADYAATLQAFSHWTHHISRGLLMVTDLQGIKQPVASKETPGKYVFSLCDPAIHTSDENIMRFTATNLGESGFELFLERHKCNDVCRHLKLPVGKSGHIDIGTKLIS